jgi:hypothetical protein
MEIEFWKLVMGIFLHFQSQPFASKFIACCNV